jgi:peptide/nickel transport system permease protein
VSMVGLSVAPYVLALVLVYVFAVELDVLPAIGYVSISEGGLAQNLRTMILPAVSIGFPLFCFYTRLLRADIVDKMQGEDYVVTAQAKGLGPWRVLLRHALPNSLFGLLTLVALNFGTLIGATVIIESIFALPGIGQALLQSINNRDILVIEAIVLVLATIVVLANLVADLLYAVLDPRIRYERPAS